MNHFERIQVVGAYYEPSVWGSGLSLQQMQAAIKSTPQGGPYRLRNTLATFLTTLGSIQAGNTPIAALIFIPDTSDAALQGATQFIPALKNVTLTFVLLGPDTDVSKLIQFSTNFIYWPDLSRSQPDNWDASAYAAYGCL